MADKQNTTIEQLSKMPIGKENRVGGFELKVRTARGCRDSQGRKIQEVVLEDMVGGGTAKITADLLLPKTGSVIQRSPVKKGDTLHIVICWLQSGKDGGKELYIEQYTIKTVVGDPGNDPSYQRPWHFQPDENDDESKWGKCRYGLVCKAREKLGFDKPLSDEIKKVIDGDVDYIIDGV